MSVEKYFLDGFGSEELYEGLKASKTFPLIRELQFTYGLKIYKSDKESYYLAYPNGFAVSQVWVSKNDHNEPQYNYRSPWYKKQRGSSNQDRETISSIKISSLMATLKRMEAVKSQEDITANYVRKLSDVVGRMRRDIGSHSKEHGLTGDEVHALLLTALGKSPNSEWVKIDQNKCQIILDKFENADNIKKTKIEEGNRFFTNPFYMIGVDINNQYLVGKFKLTKVTSDRSEIKYETVEQFKRYAKFEQLAEFIPVMTMIKLAYENETRYQKQGVFPITDIYDQSLDAVFVYTSRPTLYDHVWMVTPC